ncbi:hypothetical protein CKO15_02445 [Halorhodospira abdelmalekii]|uniref:hypothetical protein n=1 Tax=Halorhodospira abdelmalekii TaxID=421629 RepID=UPI001907C65A|nr:hypothetical protein [Halorhodospira abdelmalekii]MBK1734158.1 hypothetical protein [Halorhodospira abdelmalekii]
MSNRAAIPTLFFSALLAVTVAAGEAHALDDRTIDRWLGSMQALQEWGDEQEDLDEMLEEDDVDFSHPGEIDFEAMFRELAGEHPEIGNIIRDHGYSNSDEWARDGGRIMRATIAVQAGGVQPEMERALRELEEQPHLSEQQRAQIRSQMEQQMGAFGGLVDDVPESDLEAVKRRQDDILRVLDED